MARPDDGDDDGEAAAEALPARPHGRWSQATAEVALAGLAADPPAGTAVASAFDPPRQRFAIGDELGRGGMGRVIAATDVALLRPVAIKQLLGGGADHARFEREVRITARLEHPSIVPIHDIGRDDRGEPYYVMRRIAGEPLGDRIAATPGLTARLALLPNLLAVVDAAAFAHARGIIHRDIKPWNILLGDYGETLLIDWGLARELDQPEAARRPGDAAPLASRVYGTPGFMAPEQARGEPVDARGDVYALGATLCYLLTRTTLAVDDADGRAACARIGREVPGALVAIALRALAASPADRYRDAGELAADLRRFLTGQLVAAHRYTARERVARWVRRHRIAVTVAAAALAAIGVASGLAIINVVRERDRADAASRVATERGDLMLVERASLLADREPTRAAALLAQLPLKSAYTTRARDIAAVAAAGGIARGVVAHRGATRAIELAPDGRRLLSTGDDGAIRVHDLALGTSRTVVAAGAAGGYVTWTDAGATITFSVADGLRVVDVATGAVRVVADDVAVAGLWRADDRHVRYLDSRAHQLVERAVGGGAAKVVAREVTAAVGRARVALVDGGAGLRVIDGDVAHDLVGGAGAAAHLAIAADGRRVSAVVGDDVVAWQTATGRELERWSVGRAYGVFEGPACWFVAARRGAAVLLALCGSQPVEVLRGDWEAVWSVPAAQGVAFVATDGSLGLLDASGLHGIAHHKRGTLAIAGAAGSPYVAIAASDGTIAWWDLAAIAPPPRVVERGHELVGADRAASFLLAHDVPGVVAIDHASGARRELGVPPIVFAGPVDRAGRMLVTALRGAGGAAKALLDTASGEMRALPEAQLVVADRASGRTVLARGREIVELGGVARSGAPDARDARDAPGVPDVRDGSDGRNARDVLDPRSDSVVATCRGEVMQLAVAGDWAAAVATAPGGPRLVRIDLARGRSEELALWSAPDQLVTAADGTLWFAIARELWSWNGRWLARAAVMPSRVLALVTAGPGAAVVLADHSLWLATAAGVTSRLPSGQPRALVFGDGVVIAAEGTTRWRIALASGERTTWRSESLQTSFAIGDADRVVVVQTQGNGGEWLTRYEDRVLAGSPALRLWLAAATNARIDAATGALVWPDARDAPHVGDASAARDASAASATRDAP